MDISDKKYAEELLSIFSQFKRSSGQHPLTKFGIKPSEFVLLHLLSEHCNDNLGGMKVTDISERLGITPSGVTHTINSLEESGYIERLNDPTDRRIVLVRATNKSTEIINQLYAERLRLIEGLVEYLGEQDSKEFIRLFSRTLDFFKASRRSK